MSDDETSRSMFLAEEEIRALTNRQTKPAQRKMLQALGIAFGMRADATLVVLRSAVEDALGGASKTSAQKKAEKKRTPFKINIT